ncbi:hypothetical protein PAEPH01_0592 [Pancytospora epiphaga]|nr:hypothetical protein PAEPH01_0592 [Pancytospora epiphaga]
MDYLYDETTIGSPVSGIALSKEYIVTYHHATLCIFDHSFNLIFERYLYEKILAVKKLNDEEIIVLFRGNRAAQMTFSLESVALRTVQGSAIDVLTIGGRNNTISKSLVLVWNRSEATVFSEISEEHQIVRFGKLEIRNVEHVIFLQNYIPTLLIVWRSVSAAISHCTLVALDGVEIIESFDVIERVISVHSLGKYIILLSRHFIQIRFKREISTIELGYIAAPANASVVYRAMEHSTGEISLESPQLVLLGDLLVLINGDGEVYRIILDCDATRIVNIKIVSSGRTVAPSCVDSWGTTCVIGSLEGQSLLCRLHDNEKLSQFIVSKQRRNEKPFIPDFLDLLSLRNNAGAVTSFYTQKEGYLAFTTRHRMLSALPAINFQVHERIKLPFYLDRLFIKADGIYGEGANGTIQIIKSPMKCTPFWAVKEDDGSLFVYKGETLLRKIQNVHCWDQNDDLLGCVSGNGLVLYSMSSNKRVFFNRNICKFEDRVANEALSTSANLIEFIEDESEKDEENKESITEQSLKDHCNEGIQKDHSEEGMNDTQEERIIEILVKNEDYPFIFVRTTKQLFLYKKVGNILHKVFIPRYLSFDSRRCMFSMGECVYLRSEIPCMVFLSGGVFIHTSNCRFAMGVANEGIFYFVYKGYLVKSKLPSLENDIDYLSSHIFQCTSMDGGLDSSGLGFHTATRIADLDSENRKVKRRKSENNNENLSKLEELIECSEEGSISRYEHRFDDDIVIRDNSPSEKCPRRTACSQDYLVVATASFSSFTYVPFIPMVYISHGPGSAPVSEPINKEQETFSGPLILGRTLKYSLELRNQSLALYHTVELENNELVCDLKILPDGLVVVCTSFPEGEEKAVRGRIIVYAIRDVVPDPAFPWRDKQLCLIASESVKAPCLSVVDVRGLLAACVGTRLMIYDVDTTTGTTAAHRSTGFSAVGRNEIALLTVGIVAIENLIAVIDKHRGIRLFFLRPKDPLRLHLLSQGDPIPRATHIQYIVYPAGRYDSLSLVVRDVLGTLYIYTYSPQYPLSGNGTRLIKRGEIRTGIAGQFSDSNTICKNRSVYSSAFLSDNILSSVHAMGSSRALLLHSAISAHIIVPGGMDARNYLEPAGYVNMECREVTSTRILLEFFFMDVETQKLVLQMANLSWDDAMGIYSIVFGE